MSAIVDYERRNKFEITASTSKQVRLIAFHFKKKKQPPKLKKSDPEQIHFKDFVIQALVRTSLPLSTISSVFINTVVQEVGAIVHTTGCIPTLPGRPTVVRTIQKNLVCIVGRKYVFNGCVRVGNSRKIACVK